jgi:DNA-binding PucR family transcriptional regulator
MNQMQVATSYRYENLLDTHIYYKQALFQLKSKKCLPHDRSYRYEDNYLYHILEQCQGQIPLKSLIHPDITFLINYDNENKTEYTNTLRCFILNERNALKTANDLHIHKSTFFYRWGKIVELLELAENNGKSLFAYEFSFAILDYTKIK